MDQEFLNYYFSNHWKPSLSAHNHSSYKSIAQKISDREIVLDVGCGDNPFKKLLKNVVGIDPAFDEADYKVTIEDFETDIRFDVALCLGSINFGTQETISKQIRKIASLMKTKSRIFWRLNPGRKDHADPLCQKIEFFPWSFEKLQFFADIYGYQQINCQIDSNGKVERLYVEWIR